MKMEQLEKNYAKEIRLAEQHKKNAVNIKKQMEYLQGKTVNKHLAALNMSGAEYDNFMKLLSSGKKSVMEAVSIVIGCEKTEEVKTNADTKAETPD